VVTGKLQHTAGRQLLVGRQLVLPTNKQAATVLSAKGSITAAT